MTDFANGRKNIANYKSRVRFLDDTLVFIQNGAKTQVCFSRQVSDIDQTIQI